MNGPARWVHHRVEMVMLALLLGAAAHAAFTNLRAAWNRSAFKEWLLLRVVLPIRYRRFRRRAAAAAAKGLRMNVRCTHHKDFGGSCAGDATWAHAPYDFPTLCDDCVRGDAGIKGALAEGMQRIGSKPSVWDRVARQEDGAER